MNILTTLFHLDAALAKASVPPMSAFWKGEARRFYESDARLLIECVGRGGDKSRTSVKMAIAETLASGFTIPPGERHFYAHIAENTAEAKKTLAILENYLRILKIRSSRHDDTIDLEDLPLGFKVLASRVGAVSGFRCIGWTADECAKWTNEGADPSAEVIASIRAMTVTHARARGRMFSSPLGTSGHFYDMWSPGSRSGVVTGQAPTWVANASVTEAETRKLEPSAVLHRREYEAIPQDGALSAAFQADQIEAAFPKAPLDPTLERSGAYGFVDASAGARDAFTWAVGSFVQKPKTEDKSSRSYLGRGLWVWADDESAQLVRADTVVETTFVFDLIDGVPAYAKTGLTAEEVARRAAVAMRKFGVVTAVGDAYLAPLLTASFARHGITYHAINWTNERKSQAVETVRRWLREQRLRLPAHETLRRELHAFEEKISASGALLYAARGSGHDDFVSLIINAAMANNAGLLAGSPDRLADTRGERLVRARRALQRAGYV